MSKTIGVIGTRRRDSNNDFLLTKEAFLKVYEKGDTICSGFCPKGGDRFAVILAENLKLAEDKKLWFPPDWDQYGRGAGFVRNTYIARESDVLIACVSKDRTGGTEDTIKKWKKFHPNKEVILV